MTSDQPREPGEPGEPAPPDRHDQPCRRSRPRSAPPRAPPSPCSALFEAIGRVHPKVLGKRLPLNGAGVSGAALADLGLPLEVLRGVVLLARCAGLLGHIAEEIRRPVANSIYLTVDRNAGDFHLSRTDLMRREPRCGAAGRRVFAPFGFT